MMKIWASDWQSVDLGSNPGSGKKKFPLRLASMTYSLKTKFSWSISNLHKRVWLLIQQVRYPNRNDTIVQLEESYCDGWKLLFFFLKPFSTLQQSLGLSLSGRCLFQFILIFRNYTSWCCLTHAVIESYHFLSTCFVKQQDDHFAWC